MAIKVGDKIPSVTLHYLTAEGMKSVPSEEFFVGKKVAVFGLPGAYTRTCSSRHLPGYVTNAETPKKKGIDAVPSGPSEIRPEEGAGKPADQPLGRRAVLAAPRSDDPAVERHPGLPRARDRPFRGRDRAGALGGARMALLGGRSHHRGRQGAAFGAVQGVASRSHRGVSAESRGGAVLYRHDVEEPRLARRQPLHDRRYRLLGSYGVHGRRRVRDRELALSRSLVAAPQGDAGLRASL